LVESDPSNATIYLDDKRKGPFATTPWSGSLEGDHKIIIEKRGYTVVERPVSADPSKLFVLSAAMSQQSFLGWVENHVQRPGRRHLHRRQVGRLGRPHAAVAEHQAGQAHVLDQADGYDEYHQEIEVIPNETHAIKAQLKGSPVGKLNITGLASRTRRSSSTARCCASAGRASRACSRASTRSP